MSDRAQAARSGRKGLTAELDRLRDQMRGLGFSYDEIAIEVSRRYPVRPRQAYRLAWGGRSTRWRSGSTNWPLAREPTPAAGRA
jgi:hypothetical protein